MGISNNAMVCLLTIIPSVIGCALLLAGLTLHPLMVITPRDGDSDRSVRQLSIWRVTADSGQVLTWQRFIGSPSPMPIEIASALMIVSAVFSLSSFFKLRPSTKLVSAHGVLLSSFLGMTSFVSLSAAFSIHYDIEYRYPYWLAVTGAVVLFLGGCIGHVGRQMAASSSRFSPSNLLFYFLCVSSTGLTAAATGLPSFGDSSIFCTITQLGLCTPFHPKTKIGLWKKIEIDETSQNSTSWSQSENSFDWAVNFIFALYVMSAVFMIVAVFVKFFWNTLRGLAASLVVLGLGSSCSAQSIMSSFLSSYYHVLNPQRPSEEFLYQSQYYGTAFWLSLAGLVAAFLALVSILGEESAAKNYVTSETLKIDYDVYNAFSLNKLPKEVNGV